MAYCDHCKKNPATMHMIQFINGERTEYNLCEECAAEMGGSLFLPDAQFSLPNLLGSVFESVLGGAQAHKSQTKICPSCKTPFSEVGKTGKVGCSDCYAAFADEIESSLRRVQGNAQHVGKIPARNGKPAQMRKQIERYKQQLQKAIGMEEYEKAAEFRDKIKELEKQL